jgi:hypothetical protein
LPSPVSTVGSDNSPASTPSNRLTCVRRFPGHPEQDGRHERIHLTLKKEATEPAAQSLLQQQPCFDDFLDV